MLSAVTSLSSLTHFQLSFSCSPVVRQPSREMPIVPMPGMLPVLDPAPSRGTVIMPEMTHTQSWHLPTNILVNLAGLHPFGLLHVPVVVAAETILACPQTGTFPVSVLCFQVELAINPVTESLKFPYQSYSHGSCACHHILLPSQNCLHPFPLSPMGATA